MPHPRRRSDAPLYDPSFEHDACGIGFVADAGGRSRDRVLALALGGLAALGHRGAFGADGESSDGAGVMLPLEAPLLELLAGRRGAATGRRSGCCSCLAAGVARPRARALVAEALATEGLAVASWRRVPVDAGALGSAGGRDPAGRRPGDRRPPDRPPHRPRDPGRRVRPAPRPRPAPARDGRPGRGPRRPVGRVAVVPDRRLQGPRRRRPPRRRSTRTWPRRSRSATPCSTSATRRTPSRPGASPSRSARSPTTARSTPSAATASRSAAGPATPSRGGRRPWPATSSRPGRSSRRRAPTRSRSTR